MLDEQQIEQQLFNWPLWRDRHLSEVEQALMRWLPAAETDFTGLSAAMRYAVLDGGKRLRPLLVLAASESLGQAATTASMRAACAVELIHAYSLVHDDMPCMDNDVLRRGKPTVHVKYGEAQALLAGDALQALAFDGLVPDDGSISPALGFQLCQQLARASGCTGMAGGQAIDLASVGLQLDQAALEQMHRLKTGALLHASVMMGAACAGVQGHAAVALNDFGHRIGLAFQVVDDVLDVIADTKTLGKTAGKDAEQHKPTFVSLMGLTAAQQYADDVLAQAHADLDRSGLPHVAALHALADWVGKRSH
jgi:farnesyl diphosphate synthase